MLSLPALFFSQQVTDGLVARYSFNNETTSDDLGKNNARSYNVDFEEDRFGNKGKSAYFRGSLMSYINLGTNSLLKPKQGSISLWINCQGLTSLGDGFEANPIIWTRSNASQQCNSAYLLAIDINSQKFNTAVLDSCVNGVSAYARTMCQLGVWYHLVMTYDNNYLKFYINGELQRSLDKKFESRFLEGDSVIVGAYNDGKNKRFFLGRIDDIEIFNKVLSQDEIIQLYRAPNPNPYKEYIWYAKIILITLLFVAIVVVFVRLYVKRRLRIAEEKSKLLNHAYEQDIKVLKAQMNPHFIFNALNSIQQFIVLEQNEKALTYLSKFSKLLRKTLVSNTSDSISLRDEIEILIGYLEIESLRFNNVFEYEVKMSENLNGMKVNIPNFLIQPFVENAVWHGLLPKEKDRKLVVLFEKVDDKTLRCVIEDNGVGRKIILTSGNGSKEKSLAIDFIKQRLNLMNQMQGANYTLEIIDKEDDQGQSMGTKVILNIPIITE